MSRMLIYMVVSLLIMGLAWPWIEKIGLGKLPGDIVIKRENFSFYFPISTMIVLSVAISAIISIIPKLFK
ncbi:hypothetical protein MNBD_NITROSPINAE04-1516 [hydrothermal vent metagenome]|uniref:DUF2905 domain-containing protein n=1 Tax=hydrothermal vent metagenome TaxID=652676 RepID=A0A3B1BWI1_9ZZZZ